MTRAHTTTQTMQHCEVQRVPCVCPAMYNTEHIIQHTLQRRRSRLQHIAVFSFLGPHCTEAPAVRKQSVCFVCVRQCVCVWCVWLCMWACGRQDTEGFKRFVYRACVCVCVWDDAKLQRITCTLAGLCVWVCAFVLLGLDWGTPWAD